MKNCISPREFAIQAHGPQLYGDKEPYVVHLDAVVSILQEFGIADPDMIAAGYLHDVLEDTQTTRHTLIEAFGYPVANMVTFCTDEPGPNRKTRKAATYRRIRTNLEIAFSNRADDGGTPNYLKTDEARKLFQNAVCVKLADRIANMRQSVAKNPKLLTMYQKESTAFQEALTIPEEFQNEAMRALWAEYARLLG